MFPVTGGEILRLGHARLMVGGNWRTLYVRVGDKVSSFVRTVMYCMGGGGGADMGFVRPISMRL